MNVHLERSFAVDISPEDLTATVADYKRLWPLLPKLQTIIAKTASQDDVKACGKRLGMLSRKGSKHGISFAHPMEMDLFQDYLIYMYRPRGFSLTRKLYNRKKYAPESDEQQLLHLMVRARFSVFWIKEVKAEGAMIAVDITNGESFCILDQTLPDHDATNILAGLRIFPFRGMWIHTGASMPVGEIADPADFKPIGVTLDEKGERALNEETLQRWRSIASASGQNSGVR